MNHTYLFRRFFAAYIDAALFSIFLLAVNFILYSIFSVQLFEIQTVRPLNLLVLQASSAILFYFVVEFSFGTTPGKKLLGLQITGLINQNKKARFVQVLKRTLMRLVPFEAFSILISNEYIMWHDAVSNTKVVQKLKKGM
jgi:hypothetical protein